ncbi:hypothetical protein FE257_003261 [Aspergillus nanangensis]|uniref:Mitochondrial ATPase expression-domain-containing protein n=1 Tax=Aspergillus nanangensis TaxID=2582783 RepID=A0AAD4CSA3_ASPNN|nr:hypothetical protein FE257_003261 [Aspergillus nanangensis]
MDTMIDPRFAGLVESIPNALFTAAFLCLSPAYFVIPYREIHRNLHPTVVKVKQYKSLNSIFDDFAKNLATIVSVRQFAGHVLGLTEYTHLLDCARSIGDALMADHVWHDMTQAGVVPDLKCYNYYMEAKVWDGAHTGLERYRLRVTPYSYRKRRHSNSYGWKGYGTAGKSVRKEVLQIFDDMLGKGTYGDEATFINVMLASARVGHMQGVKNVLKTAWNVDVDAIMAHHGPQSELPPVTHYSPSSPLHPTSQLLYAVAHALGTNNDIPGALRIIDFIATAYNITIPESVWLELFERTFVLSRRRFGPNADRNLLGRVSYNFFEGMFRTMSSGPFNVRPNIHAHRMLAKTAWERKSFPDFHKHMGSAYELLKSARQERRSARKVVQEYLRKFFVLTAKDRDSPAGLALLQSPQFADAVHAYEIHRLRTLQHTIVMEQLAKLAFVHHRWTNRLDSVWEHILLPLELEEWRDFMPETFYHPLPTGHLVFHGRTTFSDSRLTPHNKVPVRHRPWGKSTELRDDEAGVLDDDFIWERLKYMDPKLDLSLAPLSRLFSGVGKRVRAAKIARARVYTPQPDKVAEMQEDIEHDDVLLGQGVRHADDELYLDDFPNGFRPAFQ